VEGIVAKKVVFIEGSSGSSQRVALVVALVVCRGCSALQKSDFDVRGSQIADRLMIGKN
jgi:hypothetical protein